MVCYCGFILNVSLLTSCKKWTNCGWSLYVIQMVFSCVNWWFRHQNNLQSGPGFMLIGKKRLFYFFSVARWHFWDLFPQTALLKFQLSEGLSQFMNAAGWRGDKSLQIEYAFGLCVLYVPVEGEKPVCGYTASCEQQVSQLTALLWVRCDAELCTSQSFMYTQTSALGCRLEKHLLFLFTAIKQFNNPSAGWNPGMLWARMRIFFCHLLFLLMLWMFYKSKKAIKDSQSGISPPSLAI